MNDDNVNGITENIEIFDKFCKILEDKNGDAVEIGEEQDMLREKLTALQQSFNDYRGKSDRGAKTIQVLQKDFKLAK